MRRITARLLIAVFAPLCMAAIWMDDQPSYKPYRAPLPASPTGSVPVSGREMPVQGELRNPLTPTPALLAEGKNLFTVNCAMCHGQTSAARGPVGLKLSPPPPGLDPGLLQGLSDGFIYNAITNGFGRMPTFRDKLAPQERWLIVNYLRTRK